MRLLLVEDDDAIAEPLVRGLGFEGFEVERFASGLAALERFGSGPPLDAVLLDLGLPDIDGFEVCRRLREQSAVPILVLTARGEEMDRVLGLELGADDYVVKPFGFRELVARIRAVTRRAGATQVRDDADAPVALGDGLVLDTRARRLTGPAGEVALTRKEFDLLELLASDRGATFRREEILQRVWDAHWYGPTKTLDVHIASLRRKLGDPTLVETVRGVGFRLRVAD